MNGTLESLKSLVTSLDEAKLDPNTGKSRCEKASYHEPGLTGLSNYRGRYRSSYPLPSARKAARQLLRCCRSSEWVSREVRCLHWRDLVCTASRLWSRRTSLTIICCISFHQLADVKIPWVILGHSERRSLFHETSDEVGKKTAAALKEGLSVIACVGETLEQREANKTMDIVKEQLEGIKAHISDWRCLRSCHTCNREVLTAEDRYQQGRRCLRASVGYR